MPQQAKHPFTEIRKDDLYFCLEQRLVTVREQIIELTIKEFEILSLLRHLIIALVSNCFKYIFSQFIQGGWGTSPIYKRKAV